MTALSDAEVEYTDKPGHLWYVRYPLTDGSGDIIIATTRPETMMGDTGVAVNPEDEKFKHLIGKTCILPIMNREIPIVGDEYCEIGFGTGAVKMTPAHDPNDFEVGLRHNLEVIRVIADDGTINENGGKLRGHGPLRVPQGHRGRPRGRGLPRQDRGLFPQRRHLLPLPQRRRAAHLRAVVREDGAACQGGHPRRARTVRSSSCPSASPRPISTGWRTSTTGASPASSGGAIRSPRGTATSAATSTSAARIRRSARSAAARTSRARRTCSTRGSAPRCGRSPRWAGPIWTRRTSTTGIRPPSWSRAMTSSSSGSRA